ncbi:hypothetical protein LSH36_500g02045 [Paralvinella palmiformis]|uniref:Uncharacterized protein n=1 Tax=Paralvinella palmiformis TaxID=53620 RepID=A0AAD9J8X9_9ANNE|nr:hypothetical protein LSH36_500g02045 [Paralvinella palmiformis]
MLTRLVRSLSRRNGALLAAMFSLRMPNAMSWRHLDVPPSTSDGGSLRRIDLANIQDATAAEYGGTMVQGFQGDSVEGFSAGWAREVMEQAVSVGRESHRERMENRQQGIQGDVAPLVSTEPTDG